MNSLLLIYLLSTIIIGIVYGSKVKTLTEYSVSSKNHSTIIIVATILGTIIGGPMLLTRSRFAYDMNLTYILGSFSTFFSLLSYYYFAPLLFNKYKDKVSSGEIIEASYGIMARRITGICSVILSVILIAAQLKVFAFLCNYIFDISNMLGLILCIFFVLSYSIFGGARIISVNMIFQFYILLIVLPLFSSSIIEQFGGLSDFITHSSIKSIKFHLSNINFSKFISVFLVYALPYFSPTIISIILMGKNNKQSSISFFISSFIFIPLLLIFILIGFTAYAINPDLVSQISFFYVTDHISGDYKSLLVIGIIAIIISSIDSYLNTASISLVHDILKTINPKIKDNLELKLIKLFNIFIMILAFLVAMIFSDIFELVTYSHLLWGSIITIPLIISLFSNNCQKINFYSSMIFSLITISIWTIFGFDSYTSLNPIIPGIISSFIGYFISYNYKTFNVN